MQLRQLVKDITRDETFLSSVEVKDICTHSKNVSHGSLFVAICGTEVDGHDFIPDAIKKALLLLFPMIGIWENCLCQI